MGRRGGTVEQPRPAPARRRLAGPELLALGLLLAGLLCLVTGLVSPHDAGATLRRIGPLLVFLFAVLILAELAARAELFDVLATRLARLAGGSYPALFALTVCLATVTTGVLNLDTTAVLLTPVMIAMAVRIDAPPLPLAMTTVWLANTASLSLPVANLTNLLAAGRLDLAVTRFAARMALPQLAAVLATAASLWLFYWRRGARGRDRYAPPDRHAPADRVLFRVAAATCAGFVLGIVAGVPIEVVAVAGAVVLVVAYAVRDRAALRWSLVPWPLLASVTGLFLIVDTVVRYGLSNLLHAAIGADPGAAGVWRAAGAGAVLANVINNLPAYLAGEAVIPAGHTDQLLGLLVGTNVGPLVLPWASLATLLWVERCRAAGVTVRWPRFIATGAVTAALALAAATAALAWL
ncbi:SLC13 family permease [Plantactinospora siamensis]|uniref:SLC13 family permease n=1 Tax=Plantactinospora siamensis TaxID=555372 RepID=A0ABV6P071_9ACTN